MVDNKIKFSDEEQKILITASTSNESIFYYDKITEGCIKIGEWEQEIRGLRSHAIWKDAINNLKEFNLLASRGSRRFLLTKLGYEVAEELQKNPNYEFEIKKEGHIMNIDKSITTNINGDVDNSVIGVVGGNAKIEPKGLLERLFSFIKNIFKWGKNSLLIISEIKD
jgi:hypothetical protein